MTIRVGINGFGRIGRQVYRAIREHYPNRIDVVAVNDVGNRKIMTHLLKYDTNYGRFRGDVRATAEGFVADGDDVQILAERDPARLPWKQLGVEVVVESTGFFREASKARAHLEAGAKKVIITAPGKNEDITIVLGVNERSYDPARHHIISNASCTTNGLAPVAKVLSPQPQLRERDRRRQAARAGVAHDEAGDRALHCTAGIGIWEWASNDRGGKPDVVMACCGDVPTLETLAAVDILRRHAPDLRIRVINVVDLMKLEPPGEHPHGLPDRDLDVLFTRDTDAAHGFPANTRRSS